MTEYPYSILLGDSDLFACAYCDFTLDRTWNITSDDGEYSYFMDFIESMANLTLDNFETLVEYETDGRISNIILRELVEFVNKYLFSNLIITCRFRSHTYSHKSTYYRFIQEKILRFVHSTQMPSIMCNSLSPNGAFV